MVTEVILKRELFGEEISQKSKSEFFSATDLVKAGNKWRMANELNEFNLSQYLKAKSTKEFIDELEKKYEVKCVSTGRGSKSNTWVHPLLFIDIALSISPKLKVEVYDWLFDHLVKFRNSSGDSYKEMSGALYVLYGNKKEFPDFISKVADYIRVSMGVSDWNTATKEQLEIRDKIHIAIKLFCNVLKKPREAIRLGVLEYIKPLPKNN